MKEQCRQNVKIIYFMGVPGIPGGRLPGGFVRGGVPGVPGFRDPIEKPCCNLHHL